MTTKQLEQANNLIDRILHIKNEIHHQEIALKCLGQDKEEGLKNIDFKLDMGSRMIAFNVRIDEIMPLMEISVIDQKVKLAKLEKQLKAL